MSARQERRRQERLEKKNKSKEYSFDVPMRFVQPWSCPVLMTRLPDHVLGKMLEITDEVFEKKEKSWGENLAGQIESELIVPHEMLQEAKIFDFFHDLVSHYIQEVKKQKYGPGAEQMVANEKWLVQMLSMWVVNQFPGEYNPTHMHTQCQISSAMYLKVPKFKESRKKHRDRDDGSIVFTGAAGRDLGLCQPTWSWRPRVGDMFIFGAQQLHHVYPFLVEEGDPERRCVAYNAITSTQSEQDEFAKQEQAMKDESLKTVDFGSTTGKAGSHTQKKN